MAKARLKKLYEETVRPTLQKELALKNIMEVPKVEKIVLNIGVKDAVADSRVLQSVSEILGKIAGQRPVKTLVRKSIASFKIREEMPIGIMATLRGDRMYEFLDRLINLALPQVRDFQGVGSRLDGRGNYKLGVQDWMIFPEVSFESADKSYGLNITIVTSAKNDEHAFKLIKSFGMPFKANNQ